MKRKIHREDIVKAGLDLMFQDGYHATGIKDITEKVQIPKGSFYNHFSSKEDFGLEVVKNYCDNGLKMYTSFFLDPNYEPIDRIENFFNALIESYTNELNFKLGCIMGNFSIEMSDVNERFRELLDEEFNRLEKVIESCIEEGQKGGSISSELNSKNLASFLLNSWHGAMLRMKSTANDQPLKDCKNMILSMLKN